jgi:hypothetical protein
VSRRVRTIGAVFVVFALGSAPATALDGSVPDVAAAVATSGSHAPVPDTSTIGEGTPRRTVPDVAAATKATAGSALTIEYGISG